VGGFRNEERSSVNDEQTVAEMADEVLMRRAEARASRGGRTGAGTHRAGDGGRPRHRGRRATEGAFRDGPHAGEDVEEYQVRVARERAEEWAEDLQDERLGGAPEHAAHG
jgi:hypothetical protein